MFEKDKHNIKFQELLSNAKNNKQNNKDLFKSTLFNKNNFLLNKENIVSLYKYIPPIIVASLIFSLTPTFNSFYSPRSYITETTQYAKLNPTYSNSFALDINNLKHSIDINIAHSVSPAEIFTLSGNGLKSTIVILTPNPEISNSVKETIDTRIDDFKLEVSKNLTLQNTSTVNQQIDILYDLQSKLIVDINGIISQTPNAIIDNNNITSENNIKVENKTENNQSTKSIDVDNLITDKNPYNP